MSLTDTLLISLGFDKPFLTVAEVAKTLCVSTGNVRKALRIKELGSHIFAGEIRVSREQLLTYIEKTRTEPCYATEVTEMASGWTGGPRAHSGRSAGTMPYGARCAAAPRGRRIELKPKGFEPSSSSGIAVKPIRRRRPQAPPICRPAE
jgi:excisionase family DNA binding protein